MIHSKAKKVKGKLKTIHTYSFPGYKFHNDFLQKTDLKEIWDIRNSGENPLFINICSENEKNFAYFYIGGSKNSIDSGDPKMVGFTKDWKNRESGYHNMEMPGKGNPEDVFYMLIVFRIPSKNPKDGKILNQKSDEKIHKILESRGYIKSRKFYNSDKLGKEEFHECPVGEAISAVYEFFGKEANSNRNWSAPFYPYQVNFSRLLSDLMITTSFNLRYYFLVSPTRSGKSIMIGLVFKNLFDKFGAKNYVILTPHPDGYSSFDKFFNNHVDSENFELFNLRGWGDFDILRKKALKNLQNGINNVFFMSWAKLKVNSKDDQLNKALEFLREIEIFGCSVDEYHREADTDKSINILSDWINPEFILGVSATPYTEFMMGYANSTNTIRIDEEIDIKKWKRDKNIPDYNKSLYVKDSLEIAKKYLREHGIYFSEDEFTYDKLFEVKKEKLLNGSKKKYLVYEDAILDVLREYLIKKSKTIPGLHDEYFISKVCNGNKQHILSHILSLVPSSDASKLVADLINNSPEFSHYKAIAWTSKNSYQKKPKNLGISKENKGTEEKITAWHEECIKDGKKSIIITCESLTTAVTLKYLSSVLLLKNISSVELFMQIIGRPNNSGTDLNIQDENGIWIPRETAAIVPKGVFLELAAKMIPYGMSIHNKKKDDFEEIIRKMFNNMNIFSFDGSKWIEWPIHHMIENIRHMAEIKKSARLDSVMINRDNLLNMNDEDKFNLYNELSGFDRKISSDPRSESIGDEGNDGKNEDNSERKKKTKKLGGSKDKFHGDLHGMIHNAFSERFPLFAIIKGIRRLDDLFSLSDSEIKRGLGISRGALEKIFEGILSKEATDYKLRWNYETNKRIILKEGIDGIFERFFLIKDFDIRKISKSTYMESYDLVKEMIEKIEDDNLLNKKIFCWEKYGAFISYLIEKFGIEILKNITIIISDPLSEDIIKYILGDYSKLAHFIFIKDVNDSDNMLGNMKSPDYLLLNPPYQKGNSQAHKLWLEFLYLSLKLMKEKTIIITPSKLFNNLVTEDKIIKARKDISNYVEYVHFFSGAEVKKNFGVSESIGYYTLSTSATGDIEYRDEDGNIRIAKREEDLKIFPNKRIEITYNILIKILSKGLEKLPLVSDYKITDGLATPNGPNGLIKRGIVKEKKTGEFRIPFIHTKNMRYYTNSWHKYGQSMKVFINYTSSYKDMFFGVGVPGKCVECVMVNDQSEAQSFIDTYTKKIFRFFVEKGKTAGYNLGIYKLPLIDYMKSWADKDLYGYFGLNKEEIDFIESVIK